MKNYQVLVSQNFAEYVDIEAESPEQARELIMQQLASGWIVPTQWDGDVFIDTPEEITE